MTVRYTDETVGWMNGRTEIRRMDDWMDDRVTDRG